MAGNRQMLLFPRKYLTHFSEFTLHDKSLRRFQFIPILGSGRLTKLEYLRLSSMSLAGSIPSEM
jgi:hypothetical protein